MPKENQVRKILSNLSRGRKSDLSNERNTMKLDTKVSKLSVIKDFDDKESTSNDEMQEIMGQDDDESTIKNHRVPTEVL